MSTAIRYGRSSNMTSIRKVDGLSDSDIIAVAPSVFAEDKHDSRGKRYAFISTLEVLDGLRREGFIPVEARQTVVRKEDRKAHTKHLLRLRHPDAGRRANGDTGEIVLLNSHDGTSAYRMFSGFFRMVCSNGLIAGDFQNDIKVRHTGNVVNNVIEGAFRVIDDLKQIGQSVEVMQGLTCTPQETLLLANTAAAIRWEGDRVPVQAQALVTPRRFEDRRSDLWTNFNVIQENVLKGGVAGRTETGRNMSTRAIEGVTENVRVNRALWLMADAFAQMKSGELDPHEFQQRLVQGDAALNEVTA